MSKKIYGEEYPRIDRIEVLRLHNFKSFKGDHIIGPFLNLTAIVGPNGSGKSNILDALCFVLAIRTSHMREGNLRQFLYRPPADRFDPAMSSERAWVEMILGKETGGKVHFKRILNSKGGTLYLIENKQVTHEDYIQELESYKLLSQIRSYFLVMQGEIDTILQNSSKDLSKIIEEISGSSEYKEKYDVLKENLENTRREIAVVSKNLQELRNEKRKAKGIKANVEAFEKARERVAQLRVELYATMCGVYDKRIEELQERAAELEQNMEAQLNEKGKIIKEKKRLKTLINDLNETQLDQEQDKEKLKKDKMKNVKKLETKLELCKSEYNDKKLLKQALEDKIAEEAAKVKKIKKEKAKLEKDYKIIAASQSQNEINQDVKEKHKEEYYSIKNSVKAQTFDIHNEIQKLQAHSNVLNEKIAVMDVWLLELKKQKAEIEEKADDLSRERLERKIKKKEAEQAKNYEDLEVTNEKLKETSNDLSMLEQQLLVSEYEQAKLEQEHEHKVQRGKELHLIEQLKTKVRGCRGLLSQLISVSQKKYENTIKIGLGKYWSQLVVDDESAAASCNISLKDAGIMKDMLILNNIPKRKTNYSATELNNIAVLGGMQLINLIEYNGNIKKLKEAIMYMAGKKIVCEDFATAKRLIQEGFKDVATLQGDVLKQGVVIAGQSEFISSLELHNKDYAVKHKLIVEKVEKLKGEINELKGLETAKKLTEINERIKAVNVELSQMKKAAEDCKDEEEELKNELINMEYKIAGVDQEREKLVEKVELIEIEIEGHRKSVARLESAAFGKFCENLGIRDISEYEGTDLVTANEFHNKKTKLINKIEELNAQLELLSSKTNEEKLSKTTFSLEKLKETISALENEAVAEHKKVRDIEIQYDELNKNLVELAAKHADLISEQTTLDSRLKEITEALSESKKELTASICQIKNNIHSKARIIEEAKLKSIPLAVIQLEEDEADYKVEYKKYDIDMSIVSSKDLEVKQDNVLQAISKEEKQIIDFNTLALIKGDEKDELEEIDKEIEDQRLELDKLSKDHEALERSFKQIKEARRQAFKTCFEQLSTHLDKIYEELTKMEGPMYGGHAILVPENLAEPYQGEIQYAPTPPGKRVVYELDQLSGGEKALAALALVLAVQKYQKAPVLVLDEIDAHLDAKNVRRLGEYLKKAVEQNEFQCIVVSHKEVLVEEFHSLLGVAHSKSLQTSQAFSLDLRKFVEQTAIGQ
eukprot:TRINITY_DN1797_c0_g1_i1.p2 TRINITY_DN1797_c0_g1~~TRINITY_DN1797_c0_g1_i1.p2  ORF type:complete len:1222 (-),score=250.53 TRINITY_DN1797_c0_g1_i1:78-3743(-)